MLPLFAVVASLPPAPPTAIVTVARPGAVPETPLTLGPDALRQGPSVAKSGSLPAIAKGRTLQLDGQPFTFQGINVYDLADIAATNPEDLRRTLQAVAWSGATVVRFMAFSQHGPETVQRILDASNALGLGLKFIPVLGNHWQHSPEKQVKSPDWYRSGYEEIYRPHVERTVAALRDRPEILMWELMNEPESSDPEALLAFTRDVSALIKSQAPHLVSLGTLSDNQAGTANGGFQRLHEVPGIDVVTWHDYALDRGATPEEQARNLIRADQIMDNVLAVGKRLNKPVFVGEVGVRVSTGYRQPPFRDAAVAMTLVEQRVERAMAGGAIGTLSWGPQPLGHAVDGDGYGFDFTPASPAGEAVRQRMTRPYDMVPAP